MLNNSKSYSFKPFFSLLKVRFVSSSKSQRVVRWHKFLWKKTVGTKIGKYSTGGESENPKALARTCRAFLSSSKYTRQTILQWFIFQNLSWSNCDVSSYSLVFGYLFCTSHTIDATFYLTKILSIYINNTTFP